jgi:hypothetical protein
MNIAEVAKLFGLPDLELQIKQFLNGHSVTIQGCQMNGIC